VERGDLVHLRLGELHGLLDGRGELRALNLQVCPPAVALLFGVEVLLGDAGPSGRDLVGLTHGAEVKRPDLEGLLLGSGMCACVRDQRGHDTCPEKRLERRSTLHGPVPL